MQLNIAPNPLNITTITAVPDTVAGYALVTLDGSNAGTYSMLVEPASGWDDAAVTTNILNWFQITQQGS